MKSTINYFSESLIKSIFWAFLLWLVARIFLFQIYSVPSDSMSNSLLSGDYVVVNKLAYGARIPITPLSIPGTNFYFDAIALPYLRIPGYSTPQRNDIIVFNFPLDRYVPIDCRQPYIKRCLALPGDTIAADLGIILVNGAKTIETDSVLCRYVNEQTGEYLYLTKQAAKKSNFTLLPLNGSVYRPVYFPNNGLIKWNADNFGPLLVPKKGMIIKLTPENILLYRTAIEVYEGNTFKSEGSKVLINSIPATSYTFKMDYYFVVGDNRYNSIDSRFWGFVPQNHLIGKFSFVLPQSH